MMIRETGDASNKGRVIVILVLGGGSEVADLVLVFIGEINFGFLSTDLPGLSIVGAGRFLGSVEGTEPDANSFPRIAYLGGPFTPRALPNPSVEILPLPLRGLLSFSTNITCLHKAHAQNLTSLLLF